ncbi:hypothetical protein G7Y89_g10235 [Cudoniella acicularis]|uniref:Carrier domain-containing protein n=1 Tax=Cudoniella acicularis TaxID=354080 RepID=A0A8H4RD53_9HELO|nr:hypothetical protein G7Y89_g10235 [Cudoniella acicularis]
MSEATPPLHNIPKIFQLSSAKPNRLIHLHPDELAVTVPDHPLFSYPKTANPQDGFVDVSSRCFANAINRTSWYLKSLLGVPENFDTICYMGPNDIRYFLFMFAAIKVGYKMLFLSPRNNLEGHLNVLEGVDCQIFLYGKDTHVQHILSQRPMSNFVAPELEELLDSSSVDMYPYMKTFEEACMDPCLVLHTTGSTGLPKPITWKVGILSTYEAWRTIPHVDGYIPNTEIYQQSSRAYTSMPLFHTSGLNAGITWSLLLGVTLVYGAPHVVPNSAYADEMHKYAGVDASMGAPSLYEELSRNPESLERINQLHYVVASGAPLSQKAGALISKHTRIISNLGATETACLQRLSPNIDDWAYFYWHPTHSGIEMRETVDGLYELFLVRDSKLELYQGIFNTFPNIQEWSMNDLYSRHPDPSKSFLYKYRCRKDDVIVLSNGEKIAPALIEATLMSDPLVKGAMIVGRGMFQPAALIDLTQDPPKGVKERHEMVERLLPVISEANEHAPAHGKLDQYHILFANPEKPICYLGQGKIQRYKTYQLYEKDIKEVYRATEDASEQVGMRNLPSLDFASEYSVEKWLTRLVTEIAGIEELETDQDFFRAGIDSLQVIKMARELRFEAKRAGLEQVGRENFIPRAFYSHPTLNQLAIFVFHCTYRKTAFNGGSNGHTNGNTNGYENGYTNGQANGQIRPSNNGLTQVFINGSFNNYFDGYVKGYINGLINAEINGHIGYATTEKPLNTNGHANGHKEQAAIGVTLNSNSHAGNLESRTMQSLFDTYTDTLPHSSQISLSPSTENMVVILTGSTGSLGSYLLESLYNNKQVSRIFCLNRSSNAAEKHKELSTSRGLSHLSPDRVEFLKADLSKPQLGLKTSVYENMLRNVTHIIHNQWPVNFNWTLRSFEPYIRGVRNLIDFSLKSSHNSFILYISSVAAVGGWSNQGDIPEGPIYDFSAASKTGYGQSKLISECLLDKAAERCGVQSACCRVGIVAGPVESKLGMWNRHEYIPSIVISSAFLGIFPATFPSRDRIDWLPVDKLSKILIEILVSSCTSPQSASKRGTLMHHVVNPTTASWEKTFAPMVLTMYPNSAQLQTCPFEEWVEILAQSAGTSIDPKNNPAIKLMDFYGGVTGKEPRKLTSFKAEEASKTLQHVGALNKGWVSNWMQQWGFNKI